MSTARRRKLDLIAAATKGAARVPNAQRLASPNPQPNARVCGCGCGDVFIPKRPHQKFIDDGHRYRAWAAMNPRARRAIGDD